MSVHSVQPTPWHHRQPLKTKRREVPFEDNFLSKSWTTFSWLQGQQSLTQKTTSVLQRQETVSLGHPWPAMKDRWLDVGSDFFTIRKSFDPGNCRVRHRLTGVTLNPTFHFSGCIFPLSPLATSWPLSGASSTQVLNAFGATAIARTSPTRSIADAAVTFGEILLNGLPGGAALNLLKSGGRSIPKKGSEAYLDWEFGLRPLIADAEKLVIAARDSEKILAQFRRDAGRSVRRRYYVSLPEVSTTSILGTPGNVGVWSNPSINAQFWPGADSSQGTLTKVSKVSQTRWFSGAFTYAIVDDVNRSSYTKMNVALQEARKLYGLTITPEVLWELTPWSWAVDWFSNLGDIISNISMFQNDGLILRYGYVMETTTVTDTYTLTGSGLSIEPPTCSFTTVTKIRRRATPFGFGLSEEALTPRQLAILAALAIAQGGKRTP